MTKEELIATIVRIESIAKKVKSVVTSIRIEELRNNNPSDIENTEGGGGEQKATPAERERNANNRALIENLEAEYNELQRMESELNECKDIIVLLKPLIFEIEDQELTTSLVSISKLDLNGLNKIRKKLAEGLYNESSINPLQASEPNSVLAPYTYKPMLDIVYDDHQKHKKTEMQMHRVYAACAIVSAMVITGAFIAGGPVSMFILTVAASAAAGFFLESLKHQLTALPNKILTRTSDTGWRKGKLALTWLVCVGAFVGLGFLASAVTGDTSTFADRLDLNYLHTGVGSFIRQLKDKLPSSSYAYFGLATILTVITMRHGSREFHPKVANPYKDWVYTDKNFELLRTMIDTEAGETIEDAQFVSEQYKAISSSMISYIDHRRSRAKRVVGLHNHTERYYRELVTDIKNNNIDLMKGYLIMQVQEEGLYKNIMADSNTDLRGGEVKESKEDPFKGSDESRRIETLLFNSQYPIVNLTKDIRLTKAIQGYRNLVKGYSNSPLGTEAKDIRPDDGQVLRRKKLFNGIESMSDSGFRLGDDTRWLVRDPARDAAWSWMDYVCQVGTLPVFIGAAGLGGLLVLTLSEPLFLTLMTMKLFKLGARELYKDLRELANPHKRISSLMRIVTGSGCAAAMAIIIPMIVTIPFGGPLAVCAAAVLASVGYFVGAKIVKMGIRATRYVSGEDHTYKQKYTLSPDQKKKMFEMVDFNSSSGDIENSLTKEGGELDYVAGFIRRGLMRERGYFKYFKMTGFLAPFFTRTRDRCREKEFKNMYKKIKKFGVAFAADAVHEFAISKKREIGRLIDVEKNPAKKQKLNELFLSFKSTLSSPHDSELKTLFSEYIKTLKGSDRYKTSKALSDITSYCQINGWSDIPSSQIRKMAQLCGEFKGLVDSTTSLRTLKTDRVELLSHARSKSVKHKRILDLFNLEVKIQKAKLMTSTQRTEFNEAVNIFMVANTGAKSDGISAILQSLTEAFKKQNTIPIRQLMRDLIKEYKTTRAKSSGHRSSSISDDKLKLLAASFCKYSIRMAALKKEDCKADLATVESGIQLDVPEVENGQSVAKRRPGAFTARSRPDTHNVRSATSCKIIEDFENEVKEREDRETNLRTPSQKTQLSDVLLESKDSAADSAPVNPGDPDSRIKQVRRCMYHCITRGKYTVSSMEAKLKKLESQVIVDTGFDHATELDITFTADRSTREYDGEQPYAPPSASPSNNGSK